VLHSHPMRRYISDEVPSVVLGDSKCVVSFASAPDYRSIEALVEVAEQAIAMTNRERLERGMEPVKLEIRLP